MLKFYPHYTRIECGPHLPGGIFLLSIRYIFQVAQMVFSAIRIMLPAIPCEGDGSMISGIAGKLYFIYLLRFMVI